MSNWNPYSSTKSRSGLPSRPRIVGATAHRYVGKNVTAIGEAISISPQANTLTLRLPDDENVIVLLQKDSQKCEPHLLTEVSGKLVCRGQLEAFWVKQFDQRESAIFNRSLYVEGAHVWNAHLNHYDI